MSQESSEICTIMGTTANARFTNGIGVAWYGSTHDTSMMVDLSGLYEGPISDEIIDAAIEKGEIVVYGDSMGDFVPTRELPVAAAERIFLAGAQRQIELLDNPPDIAHVRIGGISHAASRRTGAPGWMAPVGMILSDPVRFDDFYRLGAIYALSVIATTSDGFVEIDPATVRQAGRDAHSFVLRVEEWNDDFKQSLRDITNGKRDGDQAPSETVAS